MVSVRLVREHWVKSMLAAVLLVSFWGFGVMAQTPQVKISLLHAWDGFRDPWVMEMLAEFSKAYPYITVEPRVVNNSQLQQQFMAAYAGGIAPDVVMVSTANLVSLADQGVFLSLDDYLKKDKLAEDLWFPSEIGIGKLGGNTYGLPIRTGGEAGNVLYYNKQMFAETGIDSRRAPATWNELFAYSKKLIRYNGEKITVNPINDLTQGSSNQSVVNWLYAGNGELLSNDLRKVQFASKEAIDMADWVYQFRSGVYRTIGDDNLGNADFYNGKSAMFFWGSEGFSFVWDQNPDFPLGVGPRPKREGSKYIGANTGTWNYSITATSAQKEAAWELLKWLTVRQESAGWFIRQQGRPSPIVRFNRHPEYLKVNPLAPILGDILSAVAPVPILPIHSDLVVPFRDAFRQVAKGQAAAATVLPEAASRSQVLLDKYWSGRTK